MGAYSGIGGSGTINTIPKFTALSTIGDSAITDNGTTVTLVSRALSGTSASFSSTATATAFIPSGATVPTNGMYLSAANTLNFATNTINRLEITSTGVTTILGDGASLVYQAKTVNADLYLEMKNSAGSRRAYIGYGGASSSLFEISNSENGAIDFRTNATFAMRIASGGNVGINCIPDTNSKLDVNGQAFVAHLAIYNNNGTPSLGTSPMLYSPASATLAISTGNTERMRINSSGNVSIGGFDPTDTLGAGRILDIGSSTGGGVIFRDTTNPTTQYGGISYNGDSDNGLRIWSNGFVGINLSGSRVFTVASGGIVTISTIGTGTVTATSGVLSATSDMNLKISDGYIDTALDKILKLTPRYFYWKEETGLPTDLRQLGFYAQEVNEALGEEAANTPKKENDKWGIYDRAIIAMLTKAIQEQQAQIEELKKLVATK